MAISSICGVTAVGLLILFATVAKIPEAIKEGRNIKISKGDLTIESSSDATQQ